MLTWIICNQRKAGLLDLALNATLFNEFLGSTSIIGASWMMPIQVCFFIFIAIIGVEIMVKSPWSLTAFILGTSVFAIIVGYIRLTTGKPFPTAFFLLLGVAFLGIVYYFYEEKKKLKIQLTLSVSIFELGLLIGSILSYDNWWTYLISYNIGILIFVMAKERNLNVFLLKKLGEIGFSFFLGAQILYTMLCNLGICGISKFMTISDILIYFVSAVLFAFIITRYLEKPLLRYEKKIESRI